MSKPTISLIAALAFPSRVIGIENRLPWHLPDDLAHFKRHTKGKPVLMGRKTFASIDYKPLPQRRNLILTQDKQFSASGCEIVHSVDEAMDLARNEEELMIIGGAEIYRLFLPVADRMYLTLIEGSFEGDTFFPEWKTQEWHEKSREAHHPDAKHLYPYHFVLLER